MKKVRIAFDVTKASQYRVEVLVDNVWTMRYAFQKRKKAQSVIDTFFKTCKQVEDFTYEIE